MVAPSTLRLPDGRTLAYDDVGDPSGPAVVYLHGTPDSRLGRPPDASTTAEGIRLLAVDRPGIGDSDPDPAGGLRSFGDDLATLVDHLELRRIDLLGWSSGGLAALGAAGSLGNRLGAVALVAPVPPVEAYDDPDLVAALSAGRQAFAELSAGVAPTEVADEVAPYLVPDPLSDELAREHVVEQAGPIGRDELARVPGAVEALVRGLRASVQQETDGLRAEIVHQLERGLDLSRIDCPVRTLHGAFDGTSPPEVGSWLVGRLPRAVLEVDPDAGHHLLFPRWRGILRGLRDGAGN